jgi:hypothetical protein
MSSSNGIFHRREYAQSIATQLLHPTTFQLNVRSGVFLSGIRRIGKTTFLKQDLIPTLEADGALVIYIDLWADRSISPSVLVHDEVIRSLKQLNTAGASLLERFKGMNLGAAGLSFGFQIDSVGSPGGTTLAQAFIELIDKAGVSVVLIIDEIQQALLNDDGYNLVHALKAARDAVNSRPGTVGYFLFLGTGSHKSLVTDMSTRRSQPFMGALSTIYEPLGKDFVDWKLTQLASTPRIILPSQEVAWTGFQTMGNRPEELLKALAQLQSTKTNPDQAFPIICSTLALAAADMELQRLEELGPLGEAIFSRIALGSSEGVSGLYSGESLEIFSQIIRTAVDAPQVQNLTEKMITANLIIRSGHGVYVVADRFVKEVWLSRKSLGENLIDLQP